MDAISALLAGYLTVTQSIGNTSVQEVFSHFDMEGTNKTAEFQGYRITFWHQTWKIQDKSVCRNYRDDIVKHSKCTHAAMELFIQACDRLSEKRLSHPDYPSVKKMYCTAANHYQPTQAGIEWTDVQATKDATAIQACRLAQAALLTENTPENRYLKQQACAKIKPE